MVKRRNNLCIWIIVINVLLMTFFFWYLKQDDNKWTEVRENSWYKHINPLLECNTWIWYYNPKDVKWKIDDFIWYQTDLWKINYLAYYVRLLNNWATFWVNENELFVPASLLKIPIWIAYYKKLENDRKYGENKIFVDKILFAVNERNFWEDTIKTWNTYTIYQLIYEALVNSDNIAANLLLEYIWRDEIYKIYKDLWLWVIDFDKPDSLKISVKDYSTFFRVLYNASYLNRESSEEILSILLQWSFTSWIRRLIPDWVEIANKFWEREIIETWEKQLHDCWIIYKPNNPYMICIMSRWNNFDELSYTIQMVSKMIFDDIN